MGNEYGWDTGGFGMPPMPWMYACGFRTVVGMLLELKLPKEAKDTSAMADHLKTENCGTCRVLVSAGVEVKVDVDEHTAIIGLNPLGTNGSDEVNFHPGELVQINLVARDKRALSVERYFTNVRHMSNT